MGLQYEKKKKPKTAKPSKPSAYGEETDTNTDTDTDRPSLPKTGTREEPSNREKYSDRPHSDIQMPKKGVPSKLLPYERREMPSKPEEEVDGEIPYDSEEQDTPSSRPSPKHQKKHSKPGKEETVEPTPTKPKTSKKAPPKPTKPENEESKNIPSFTAQIKKRVPPKTMESLPHSPSESEDEEEEA